jgi:hypothetical protein
MGLDTTHNCWHGDYSSFMTFRIQLAKQIGINLLDFAGFDGNKSWKYINHDIKTLLKHSDCDGSISANQAKKIVSGLNSILENFKTTGDNFTDDRLKERIIQFRDGCLDAISKNESVLFR